MRRWLFIGLAVIAVVGGYYGYTAYVASQEEAAPQEVALDQELEQVIWASGTVVPARWANLSFEMGGRVVQVAVEENDAVSEGQVLAQLDDTDLEEAVAQAEAALVSAQAALARAQVGARAEEIAAAQAGVSVAEAALSTAQANLAAARAELARLRAGPKAEEIAAAKATMDKAAAVVQQAQAEYDKISWSGAAGASPQAVALQQATADYEAAKATYQALLRGATPEEIAVAQAAVAAAKAQVRGAEAQVERANAQLALLRAGPLAEDVAIAQANVRQAELALEQARAARRKARLVAPFPGTVGAVVVRMGEQVLPGQPAITLGDLAHLRIETTDLRETDVAKVRVGQSVELTFDALPDEVLSGRVTRIAPMSNAKGGSTNYTAIIEMDTVDPRLRWGMTAYVNIEVGQ